MRLELHAEGLVVTLENSLELRINWVRSWLLRFPPALLSLLMVDVDTTPLPHPPHDVLESTQPVALSRFGP
jgi:hypothetical protein